MKKLLCFMAFLTLMPLVAIKSFAFTAEQAEAANVPGLYKALPQSAKKAMRSVKVSDGMDPEGAVKKIIKNLNIKLPKVLRNAVKGALSIFAVSCICGIAGAFLSAGPGIGGGQINFVNLAGAAAITIISVSGVSSMLGLCTDAISEVSLFAKVLMPAVATAAGMAGMPLSGSAQCYATLLFSEFLISVINRVIMPFIYAYIALITANAALTNDLLKKSADFIKWVCTFLLKLILTVFVAYISVSGAVSGSADAFSVKTLKFAASGMLPVIGSIVGDASESMIAGAGILKNAIGVYGMLAILAICFYPLVSSGIHYLVYKATAAFSSSVCSKELGDLIDGIAASFGLAFGVLGGCVLMFCISLTIAIAFLKSA
ncbi:MAG: hypothetical protein Q8878_03705 [Bacillota bacterium]|nr:hypothetical protein [Bacillota bacterium]